MPSRRELLAAELEVAELEERFAAAKGTADTVKKAKALSALKVELREKRRRFRDLRAGTQTDERGRPV